MLTDGRSATAAFAANGSRWLAGCDAIRLSIGREKGRVRHFLVDHVVAEGSGTTTVCFTSITGGFGDAWSLEFWGSQGRLGNIQSGPWAGSLLFAYPDTLPEWWTFVVDPSPYPGLPGDHYEVGTEKILEQFDEWKVEWIPRGPEESIVERERFGWRPLVGPVDWLQD